MKALHLEEIIKQIGGVLFQGSKHFVVKNIVARPEQVRNDTLLFDLDHKIELYNKILAFYPSAIVVTENVQLSDYLYEKNTIVQVRDIHEAYWKFIRYYRSLFDLPVIGVTGTCGKTTTKEMIAFILSSRYNVQSTYKSKNSIERHFSYLLGIDDETDVAVFEMGVACPDDLIHSSHYFQPQIGIMTTIGTDHLEHCGTQENYIKEKAKLLRGLKNKGILILNADDENIRTIDKSGFQGKIIYFGIKERADYRAEHVRYAQNGMEFILHAGDRTIPVYVPGYGEHNVYNALAAIAASCTVGLEVEKAAERLASFVPIERHLQFYTGMNGCTVIDDTWSSNPTSAEAALKVLKMVSQGKKTIAVLGKMELLGKQTIPLHAKIGEKVVDLGIDVLITIDDAAKHIGLRALELGMKPRSVYFCHHPKEIYEILHHLLDEHSIVLVKTSMLDSKQISLKTTS